MNIRDQAFDFQCEACSFYNVATLWQAATNDVVICRGCKINLRLVDSTGSAKASCFRIESAMEDLLSAFHKLGA